METLSFGWMTQQSTNKADNLHGMGKIMETLDNIEIKLFVLGALK